MTNTTDTTFKAFPPFHSDLHSFTVTNAERGYMLCDNGITYHISELTF